MEVIIFLGPMETLLCLYLLATKLFDYLRDIAVSQNVVDPSQVDRREASLGKLNYAFLGQKSLSWSTGHFDGGGLDPAFAVAFEGCA